jgi:hypothetical protein
MQRSRWHAGKPSYLADVETLVRVQKQQRQDRSAVGTEQNIDDLRSPRIT